MAEAVGRRALGWRPMPVVRALEAPGVPDRFDPYSAIAGTRVLVVENRFIVAEEIVDLLLLLRCEPVGPAATLSEALGLIERCGAAIDVAVLDINLEDEMVYPAAAMLQAAGTPFAFATGYNDLVIPAQWSHVPRLEKPYGAVSLRDTLDALLDGWPSPQPEREPGRQPAPQPGPFEHARRRRERQMEDAVLHKWRSLSGD